MSLVVFWLTTITLHSFQMREHGHIPFYRCKNALGLYIVFASQNKTKSIFKFYMQLVVMFPLVIIAPLCALGLIEWFCHQSPLLYKKC